METPKGPNSPLSLLKKIMNEKCKSIGVNYLRFCSVQESTPMQSNARPATNPNPALILPPEPLLSEEVASSVVVEFESLVGVFEDGDGAAVGALTPNKSLGNNTLSTWKTASGKTCLKALLTCVSTRPLETFTWLAWPVKFSPHDPPSWLEAWVLTGLLTNKRSFNL